MDSLPEGLQNEPGALPSLRFSPLGLYDLRRHLGRPGNNVYRTYRNRFDASDVAWFAAGMASLPCANIGPMDFPPEFGVLRSQTGTGEQGSDARRALRQRVSELTFDMAALWDRAFGGTTLVIHVDGTTRPGSLSRPDYVKSDVYFPGYLLNLPEHATISATIADLVQKFIVDIGVSTVTRYERRARRHWHMNNARNATETPYATHALQPPASPPESSMFVYHGRLPVVVVDDDDDDETASRFELVVDTEIDSLKKDLEDANAALKRTEDALADALRRERELQAQLGLLTASYTLVSAQPALRTPHRSKTSRGPSTPNIVSPGSAMVPSTIARPSRSGLSDRQPHTTTVTTSVSHAQKNDSPSSRNALAEFVHALGIPRSFSYIDLTRRNVSPFLWQSELAKQVDLNQKDLEDLMAAMQAYSAAQNDGKDV